MPRNHVTVEQWVELFHAIGLQDEDMHRWHTEFEHRYPDGHESFLKWLDLSTERIKEIRRKSVAGF